MENNSRSQQPSNTQEADVSRALKSSIIFGLSRTAPSFRELVMALLPPTMTPVELTSPRPLPKDYSQV